MSHSSGRRSAGSAGTRPSFWKPCAFTRPLAPPDMRNVLQQNWRGRRRLARADLREEVRDMRYESSVTSVSWIPSEAVRGLTRVTFDSGVTHYDDPPPDVVDDLETLAARDECRL